MYRLSPKQCANEVRIAGLSWALALLLMMSERYPKSILTKIIGEKISKLGKCHAVAWHEGCIEVVSHLTFGLNDATLLGLSGNIINIRSLRRWLWGWGLTTPPPHCIVQAVLVAQEIPGFWGAWLLHVVL